MTSRRALVAVVTLILVLHGPAARALPPAAGAAKANTRHEFLREALDFQNRLFAGQYLAVGKRDPKWDGPALEFLEAMAIYFVYTNEDPVYTVVEPPSREQLEALGRAAADAGCNDPLVTYLRGANYLVMKRYEEAGPLVLSSVDGLARRKYHPWLVSLAAGNLAPLPSPQRDTVNSSPYARMAWEQAMAALSGKIADADLRQLWSAVSPRFDDHPLARKLEFCKTVEGSTEANPWLVNLLYGKYEVKAAWAARGGGFANTVTDKGWAEFYEHLSKARDYLVKAHTLHPEFPEAATEMIDVAMGGGSRLNEKERDWFDKATKAQFDYAPAYNAYLWSIYPRWSGSYKQMLDFGLECMATRRYDTIVPTELLRVIEKIDEDSGGRFAIYSVPEVQTVLRELFKQVAAQGPQRGNRDYYASYQVAIAWRTGQFREAGELLDKIGDRISAAAFDHVRAWAPGAVSEIRAINSPQASKLVEAARLATDGDIDSAVRAYDEASSTLGKDHPGQLYLHFRSRSLTFLKEFEQGGWVALKPGADLAPWSVASGEWKLDKDGSFVATSDKHGRAALVCRADFGKSYEIKAKIDFPDAGQRSVAAIFVNWSGPHQHSAAGINGTKSSVFLSASPKSFEQPIVMKGGEEVTLRVDERSFEILLDGQVVFANRPGRIYPSSEAAFVAIGIDGSIGNRVAKFSDVQIRRVKADGGH